MKVQFNPISFKSWTKTFYNGENKITEYYDDNNLLIKTLETDKFSRDVDTKEFNEKGDVVFHLHKKYEKDGKIIETCKDRFQEYTRTVSFDKKGEFTHRIEEYVSKLTPENNYVHEFIKDSTNKLVKIICNGKVIDLMK